MLKTLDAALRWLSALWSDSPDPAVRTYRRHVRGILTGWAVTATAMALIGMYPNELELSMYQLLLTQGLPAAKAKSCREWRLCSKVKIPAPSLTGSRKELRKSVNPCPKACLSNRFTTAQRSSSA